MRTLCVQLQRNRARGLSTLAVTQLMVRIAERLNYVRQFSWDRGRDRGPYINYCFRSRSPARVWAAVKGKAFGASRFGPLLRRSTIVTCEGSRGWDNYLLLHHFNGKVQLDQLHGV
jgi:hypothetical protein